MTQNISIIDTDLKKWVSETTYNKVLHSRLNDSNTIEFTFNKSTFKIICPKNYPDHKKGHIYIDFDENDNDINWISFINVYAYTKNPTLYDLLSRIDDLYKEYLEKVDYTDNKFSVESDFAKDEDMIDSYDMEIDKLKAQLEHNTDSISCFVLNEAESLYINKNDTRSKLLTEFVDLVKKYKDDNRVELTVVNNNIYHWRVKFKKFDNIAITAVLESLNKKYGYDYLEVEIFFHHKCYPIYPPLIKYVKPRLSKSLIYRISNLKMIQCEYWNPNRGMEFVITKLHSILNKHSFIDVENERNYLDNSCTELEDILMEVATYCSENDYNDIDGGKYDKMYTIYNNKFIKGDNITDNNWDFKQYQNIEYVKAIQIVSLLNKLYCNISNTTHDMKDAMYYTIAESYLIAFIRSFFNGVICIDIDYNYTIYTLLCSLMQLLVIDDKSAFLFDHNDEDSSLFLIMKNIAVDAAKLINNCNSLNEQQSPQLELYHILVQIYNTLKDNFKKYEDNIEENKYHKYRMAIDDTYKSTLVNEIFGEEDIIQKKYFYQARIQVPVNDDKMIKYISIEYANLKKSLMAHGNNILFRMDLKDLRVSRILIIGPDNTPYESGIFVFDILCDNNFPDNPPNMMFVNHGSHEFNPYMTPYGKICLSILDTGTNHGSKWIPNQSTLYQVMETIQNKIFISNPYSNHADYDLHRRLPIGKQKVQEYIHNVKLYTMQYAMTDIINKPDVYGFNNAILQHFKLKKNKILQVCGKWVNNAPYKDKKEYNDVYDKLKKSLDSIED